MSNEPKYKIGNQFVDREPPQNGIFTILAISVHPNRFGEWVYFYEVDWRDGQEYDHGVITEKDIKRVFKRKK